MQCLLGGVVMAWLLCSPAAIAQAKEPQKEIIGVLKVTAVGVSEQARTDFRKRLKDQLKEDYRVVSASSLNDALLASRYVNGCISGTCLKEIYQGTRGRVGKVVVASLTGVGSAYSIIVSIWDTRTGQLAGQDSQDCQACTVEEALLGADNAATAAINGMGLGANPDMIPGILGKTVEVSASPARRTSRRTAIVLVITGVALGATSGLLLRGDKDTAGYSALAAGGAFFTSGVTLWMISRKF